MPMPASIGRHLSRAGLGRREGGHHSTRSAADRRQRADRLRRDGRTSASWRGLPWLTARCCTEATPWRRWRRSMSTWPRKPSDSSTWTTRPCRRSWTSSRPWGRTPLVFTRARSRLASFRSGLLAEPTRGSRATSPASPIRARRRSDGASLKRMSSSNASSRPRWYTRATSNRMRPTANWEPTVRLRSGPPPRADFGAASRPRRARRARLTLKVIPTEIGGGFGGKLYIYLEPVARPARGRAARR